MIRETNLGYTGMQQDLAKSKAQGDKYFSARNIRIVSTDKQSTFAIRNEHGNELEFQIPTVTLNPSETRLEYTNIDDQATSLVKHLPYERSGAIPGHELETNYSPTGVNVTSGDQIIIGTIDTRNGAIIATTDDNGFDCIWELDGLDSGVLSLDLRYMNNLNFSTSNLIQLMYNYENSIIEKVYFADGVNQLRYINLRQSKDNGDLRNLIDNTATAIDIVSQFNLSQPYPATVIGGGGHTSGMIQYAYNLYILNGAQTTISPVSELTALDKGDGLGGGAVNESVGATVVVNIDEVDSNFTHIKLYAIKYTSYNQTPEISLIADREIDNFESFSYFDDGNVISPVSLAEFLFLGSNPIIPRHIESKDSRMFAFNIKEQEFDVDIDTRCYGHNAAGEARVWENVQLVGGGLVGDTLTIDTSTYNVPEKHDAVNRDYDEYRFTSVPAETGYEGKFMKLLTQQIVLTDDEAAERKFLKDREIYRFGVEFYNDLGQTSPPKWIADVKAPTGNLQGMYNTVSLFLKPEFFVWLNTTAFGKNEKPVGYRLLRADRTLNDRTIIAQGMINSMVANFKHDRKESASLHQYKNAANKMPSMTRLFEDSLPQLEMTNGRELSEDGAGNWTFGYNSETITSCSSDDFRAQTWQFNRMMQMFTPELLFESLTIDASYKLNVLGLQTQSEFNNWSAEYNPVSKQNEVEAKFLGGGHFFSPGVVVEPILDNPQFLMDHSLFGPTNGENTIQFHQFYREFFGTFHPNTGQDIYEIYGSPEITERGADFKAYNGDFRFRYANHLRSLLQDDWRRCSSVHDDSEQQVYGVNSFGARCITFCEGPDESTFPPDSRKRLEQIFAATNIAETQGVLIAEFTKDNNALYLGNIYGGNSFEAKSTSTYIQIGNYSDFNSDTITPLNPGDTFVQNFEFTKLSKTDTDPGDRRLNQMTEIVAVRVETTVDLKNRNDLSLGSWDNRWQPRYEEFQEYNRVYSQQPTLVRTTDPGFKFKKVKEFDTRITASKEKIPGENIDSWTDFLENERSHLDGQYGPINGVINFRDEIYTFQDTGVAHISINPRVQTTGSDGVEVQLGTGKVLHDYQYLTTKSGCVNKWSIVASENGFYYFDLLNKSIVRFSGGINGLSDQEGMHHFLINNIRYEDIVIDNPVLRTGVSTGYNSVNNDVYFSFHQKDFSKPVVESKNPPDYSNHFNLAFNEATDSFTSFYDYVPAWFINKGDRMITTEPESKQLWQHFKGENNSFYGTKYFSEVLFNVAPMNGQGDLTFNNLSFKMEMKDADGNDLRDETFTHVRAYNEYQDSGFKGLTLRGNLKRRNRNWSLTIPREEKSRNRIKSPWFFLQLRFDNPDNKSMIAHDMKVSYTAY